MCRRRISFCFAPPANTCLARLFVVVSFFYGTAAVFIRPRTAMSFGDKTMSLHSLQIGNACKVLETPALLALHFPTDVSVVILTALCACPLRKLQVTATSCCVHDIVLVHVRPVAANTHLASRSALDNGKRRGFYKHVGCITLNGWPPVGVHIIWTFIYTLSTTS